MRGPRRALLTRLAPIVVSAGLAATAAAQSSRPPTGPATPPAIDPLEPGRETKPAAKNAPAGARASGSYRDRFESGKLMWRREETDAAVQILAHEWTEKFAREGKGSERVSFNAGIGSSLYYSHEIPHTPIDTRLEVSLYVRSSRTGARLQARVVLPGDIDPDTRGPSFIVISGGSVDTADRWQKLTIDNIPLLISRQARNLRIAAKRPVNLEGAYIDQIVINLYEGAGETDAYLDELEVYPVPADALEKYAVRTDIPAPASSAPGARANARPGGPPKATIADNIFRIDGKPWVFSMILPGGARLLPLRQSGFDIVGISRDDSPEYILEATKRGFLLAPDVAPQGDDDAQAVLANMAAFPAPDWIAFWDLGSNLGASPDPDARKRELSLVREVVAKMRLGGFTGPKFATARVDGMIPEYARPPKNLDLIGIDLKNWGRQRDPTETFDYVRQRLDSGFENPNIAFWALIDAAPDPAFQRAIWGDEAPPDWGVPRVQPEQLRIWTYLALSAGCRGIGFRGNADLTGPQGIPLRNELAFLNLEISLFRSLLALAKRPGPPLSAYPADPMSIIDRPAGGGNIVRNRKPDEVEALATIKAATFHSPDKRTYLLLVTDMFGGSQWQPQQSSVSDMRIIVPALEGAQGFEISPGGVRKLQSTRKPGGIQIALPDFGVTSMIVVTTDLPLVERIEAQIARNRALACQMAVEQANHMISWVSECDDRLRNVWENPLAPIYAESLQDQEKRARRREGAIALVAEGRTALGKGRTDVARRKAAAAKDLDIAFPPLDDSPERVIVDADAIEFLHEARELVKDAQEQLEAFDYTRSWNAARRAGRPLRLLMREHFDRAVAGGVDAVVGPRKAVRTSRQWLVRDPDQLVFPIASPPIVAFNTLPQHWLWVDKMRDWRFGPNLLKDGDFENPDLLESAGWEVLNHGYEGIDSRVDVIERVRPNAAGKRILRLNVAPVFPEDFFKISAEAKAKFTKEMLDEMQAKKRNEFTDRYFSPFLDQPSAGVTTPPIKVKANQLVRVRVWVKKPLVSAPGAGGLIIRDSLSGEPLQIRLFNGTLDSEGKKPGWKEIVFFRRAPADGEMRIFIGLAGYGLVEVDDLRIELGTGDAMARGRLPSRTITRTPRPAELPLNTSRLPRTGEPPVR